MHLDLRATCFDDDRNAGRLIAQGVISILSESGAFGPVCHVRLAPFSENVSSWWNFIFVRSERRQDAE
jgi:hypothetical protein